MLHIPSSPDVSGAALTNPPLPKRPPDFLSSGAVPTKPPAAPTRPVVAPTKHALAPTRPPALFKFPPSESDTAAAVNRALVSLFPEVAGAVILASRRDGPMRVMAGDWLY